MERRIKRWFKCILGKHKQLDHRLSKLESHILRGELIVVDDPPPDLEGDSDELDDCVHDPLYENLCFVKVCYFVHYTWDCWCSFKFRWLHILLSYSTMFMFALFGNLAMSDCS